MGLFKKIFGKKGFFDKIGRGIDKASGGLSSKLLNGVKKIAYSVPVVGPIAKVAVEDIGGALVGSMGDAAVRDGIVKADKIAQTVLKSTATSISNPTLAKEVGNAIALGIQKEVKTQTGMNLPIASATTAPSREALNPSGSNTMDKIKAKLLQVWEHVKKYWYFYTGGIVVLGLIYFLSKGTGRKKWRV
ncbi:hypothetical protein KEM09_12090 [Carboxylicivirga mesophila]|uniref:Uncharacterized protein n=1 Tax=Carboxylicivirga mesophila TaxID=1166478 RepID=A0ABS5KAU7_9BACT|nr:hypothetical protein [Carboxylicivirga mesophila]MBS2212150.1 hypothetical protein [Carboxylicivirga mesophila]